MVDGWITHTPCVFSSEASVRAWWPCTQLGTPRIRSGCTAPRPGGLSGFGPTSSSSSLLCGEIKPPARSAVLPPYPLRGLANPTPGRERQGSRFYHDPLCLGFLLATTSGVLLKGCWSLCLRDNPQPWSDCPCASAGEHHHDRPHHPAASSSPPPSPLERTLPLPNPRIRPGSQDGGALSTDLHPPAPLPADLIIKLLIGFAWPRPLYGESADASSPTRCAGRANSRCSAAVIARRGEEGTRAGPATSLRVTLMLGTRLQPL